MQNYIQYDPLIKYREKDLVDKPIVIYVNRIKEDMVASFHKAMSHAHTTGQPVIPIVVDSFGGCAYALMSLVNGIQNAEIPVATIVESKAMSSGAILFTCGTPGYRYMSPSAALMIHDVSSSANGKTGEVQADAAETKRINESVHRLMATNCGQEEDYFLNLIHEQGHSDFYLTAEMCKEHKIADHLRVPKMRTKVSVTHEFD